MLGSARVSMEIAIFAIDIRTSTMGYPLSTFQQLALLCREEPYVRHTFDKYRMMSVIVHDPSDDGFRRTIKYSFEHLHEVTGVGFAFISFINPPTRWAQTHADWMDLRERLSAGNGMDDAGFVGALRNRLDLPDGPCLVLSEDLLSDRYIILPTSSDEVVPHMEAIGEFVNCQPGRFPADSPEFLAFLSNLGPAFSERTVDGNSLAKNIADLAAVRALTGAGASNDRMAMQAQKKDAFQYVRDELQILWNELQKQRESDDGDMADEILGRFSDYLALVAEESRRRFSFFSTRHLREDLQNRPYEDYYLLRKDFDGMELLSQTYLSNYNNLLPLYFGTNPYEAPGRIDMESLSPRGLTLDYSPLGNYLGTAVEEEMNASLIQRARQLMGVHMPDFYRRFEVGLNDRCEVITKQKRIFLNWRGKKLPNSEYTDRSIPMGEVVCILRELATDEAKRLGMQGFCESTFIDNADCFARLRNEACHSGIFGRSLFDNMFHEFDGVRQEAFPGMFRLKEYLRCGGEPPELLGSLCS